MLLLGPLWTQPWNKAVHLLPEDATAGPAEDPGAQGPEDAQEVDPSAGMG